MAGENAEVEIRIHGEYDVFWLDPVVNGQPGNTPVHVASIEAGQVMSPELEKLVKTLYRKAYRDGHAAASKALRDALRFSI